jgi:NAD(P)-dependent dehydrogenase (short-subunit alcohol dehydrogenase family)
MTNKSKLRTLEHYTELHHRDTYPTIDETLPSHSCKGRSVFITGAGTGIGKAIALSFARAGASAIYIASRRKTNLEETKKEALKIAPECRFEAFEMDVVNATQVLAVFAKAASFNGKPLDILVSNAGYVAYLAQTSQSSFDNFWNHFEVNVKGSFLVIQEFLKVAVEEGATIVNVSSGAAVINYADGLSSYSAAKVAMVKVLDYMHREESHRDLRIFSIHPGVVPTAMADAGKQSCSDTGTLRKSLLGDNDVDLICHCSRTSRKLCGLALYT